MTAIRALGGLILGCVALAPMAAADPVADAFYARCVSENSYQMQPAELDQACACMAPVLVSFLTVDARRQVEESIKTGKPVSFSGSPYKGNPAELARSAINQCPSVGVAMYNQNCQGTAATTPQCEEMKGMIDQAQ